MAGTLAGRVALVTGASSGIGAGAALALAEAGATVAVSARRADRLEALAKKIEAAGGKALALPGDVVDQAVAKNVVEQTVTRFGRLDILVNNVGGVTRRNFIDLQPRNWARHIDLNLTSNLAATSAAVPFMIEGGRGGSIINVTSIEASRAAPGYAVYAACKAGINNLTRTLALEFAEHGIRVNAIAPDFTVTPGTRGNFTGPVDESKWHQPSESALESVRRRIPAGRAGIDEECGMAAVFLASKMASYVTGTVLPVDGGSWASSGWVRDSQEDWILPPEWTA